MASFWRRTHLRSPRSYDLNSLIDTEILLDDHADAIQIICDVDKTYIETKFENAVGMIKIAFENADAKVAVSGAAITLLAARWGAHLEDPAQFPGARPLHFLSASPPQLRRVIRHKLAKDGLDWSSDTFKNQAYNLRMGRLNLLKQHVAYKTATILHLAAKAKPGTRFILIGDNAELDAFIYVGVQLFLSGNLSPSGYREYLALGKVETEILATLDPLMAQNFSNIQIAGILIRNAPGYSFSSAPPLSQMVLTFDSYFEVLLHFFAWKLVPAKVLSNIVRRFHNDYGFSREELIACLERVTFHVSLSSLDSRAIEEAKNMLRQGPPLGPLPNRAHFHPGQTVEKSAIDQTMILAAAKDWVKSIEDRD